MDSRLDTIFGSVHSRYQVPIIAEGHGVSTERDACYLEAMSHRALVWSSLGALMMRLRTR